MAYQYVAWNTNITEDVVETKTFQPAIATGNDVGHTSWDLFPAIHLSKIRNPLTKREVEFIYENNSIVDNNRFSEIKLSADLPSNPETIYHEHDYSREKLLKKIIFPDGFIDFYYEGNRLDSRGGKILKKIEVRNKFGNLIKGIAFEQNYTTSMSGCTDDFYCKKLLLSSISFFDQNNNKLPGYSFNYNNSLLPKRYSLDQDFLGFYNGNSGVAEAYNVPKIYFKANQGKISYLPFPFSDYQLLANGNVSKVPVLLNAIAYSLEKITTPTGGYTMFEYELHSFDFLGSTINSGGLRIKSEAIFDSKNNLQKKLNYNYNKDNGITSGQIVNLPNYVIQTNANDYAVRIYQNYNNKLESNNSSSYVGYSQVKIFEEGNGYKINTYTNVSDFPNIYPSTYSLIDYNGTYPEYYNSFLAKVNNGLGSTIFKDYSSQRGNLISSKIFNNNNLLIKSLFNEYEYKKYTEYPVSQIVCIYKGNSFYSLNPGAYALFNSSVDIQSNLLKKTTSSEYSTSGQIADETTNTYYLDKPFLNEVTKIDSNGNTTRDIYSYPFDTNVSGLANVSALNTLNILKPIKKINYSNNEVTGTSIYSYQNFDGTKILPLDLQRSKGNNSLDVIETYSKYDIKGNLIEYAKKDGTSNVAIYGYNYQFKIAEIIGANYNQVLTALGIQDIDILQTKTNNELEIIFNNLRIALPNSLIYSYTYIPLIGVNSITDPKGISNYFEYDNFNRLSKTKDSEQNIITEQKYNYALTTSSSPILQESLSLEISKSPTLNYIPYTSSPNFTEVINAKVRGGRGNYSYEWTLSPSNTVLGKSADFSLKIPCGTTNIYNVKVTDTNGGSISQNVTVNAASCSEAFFVGAIEGTSSANNQYDFWINAEGGSFKFKYTWWFTKTITTQGGSSTITNHCPKFLTNTSSSSSTGTLYVEIKDLESGYTIQRSRTITIYPQASSPSCFIAGTTITMSDGTLKKIEEVSLGDSILTYNTDKNKIEIGNVEAIVTPLHSKLIELQFENNSNTNTLDHPYYVKNKGWCSYDPKLTLTNYGLKVKKYKIGDIVLQYDNIKKKINEIHIKNLILINREQKTYNLQKVSKNHDFFANGILVHNKNIF